MTSLDRFSTSLRKIPLAWGSDYVNGLLGSTDLARFLGADLFRSGAFFASVPKDFDLSSLSDFEVGLRSTGYRLKDRLPDLAEGLTSEDISQMAVLDPYFTVEELSESCPQVRTLDSEAGAWQFAPVSQLSCCREACNYFFPILFFVRTDSRLKEINDEKGVYRELVSTAAAVIVEAFDNDGFLMWVASRGD